MLRSWIVKMCVARQGGELGRLKNKKWVNRKWARKKGAKREGVREERGGT